jgi:uncharacterized protein YjbJ (UPF0337 family)
MNKDQRNGIGQSIKGRIKQAAGAILGNKKIEAEGIADRVVGAAKAAVGEVKHDVAKKLDR